MKYEVKIENMIVRKINTPVDGKTQEEKSMIFFEKLCE